MPEEMNDLAFQAVVDLVWLSIRATENTYFKTKSQRDVPFALIWDALVWGCQMWLLEDVTPNLPQLHNPPTRV
jgi:hypothetical protein